MSKNNNCNFTLDLRLNFICEWVNTQRYTHINTFELLHEQLAAPSASHFNGLGVKPHLITRVADNNIAFLVYYWPLSTSPANIDLKAVGVVSELFSEEQTTSMRN